MFRAWLIDRVAEIKQERHRPIKANLP